MARIAKHRPKNGKIKEVITKQGEKRYHVRIRLKGAPVQCGVFPNVTKAEQWIQQVESSIREGRYFKNAEAKKHSLGELVDRYIKEILPSKPKSYDKQKMQLLWWKAQIGHCILSEFSRSPAALIEHRDKLAKSPTKLGNARSPSTVIRYLAALSHAFTVAVKEWGWMDDNPMRKVSKPKEPRGRERFLSTDERTRLLQACRESANPYLYLIVVVALSTGMRFSEILNLTWKDLEFEHNRIILRDTKNGESRPVALVGYAREQLFEHSKKRRLDTFLVFPGVRDPSIPITIRHAWSEALEKAGVEDFKFHDLRHSFGSEMNMNRATDQQLRILLGHKSPKMTARYTHMSTEYCAAIVGEMTDKIFSSEKKTEKSGEAQ